MAKADVEAGTIGSWMNKADRGCEDTYCSATTEAAEDENSSGGNGAAPGSRRIRTSSVGGEHVYNQYLETGRNSKRIDLPLSRASNMARFDDLPALASSRSRSITRDS